MFPIRDHNPSGQRPYVTYVLLLANVLVFALMLPAAQNPVQLARIYADWAMIPARISLQDGYLTFVSSMFLHGGALHLAGNMLFLWIFGDNLEDRLGHGGFLRFYLATGVLAGLLQYLADPGSPVPVVGASGAIAGVMGGYLLFFPRARVDILIVFVIYVRMIPVPAFILLGLWFAMQVFGGLGAVPDADSVAYWAHIGGFVAGILLCLPKWLREGGPAFWSVTKGRPPHPDARYPLTRTNVPRVTRRK